MSLYTPGAHFLQENFVVLQSDHLNIIAYKPADILVGIYSNNLVFCRD